MSKCCEEASFKPILPHEPIEEIAKDLFVVRGSVYPRGSFPPAKISRNMVILRHGGGEDGGGRPQLTLVNTVRISPAEEEKLCRLGDVKRVIRLGTHARDDPYYKHKFGVELAVMEGDPSAESADVVLTEESELPFPDARLFAFRGLEGCHEGALLLENYADGGGLLLTSDSLHSWMDRVHTNFIGSTILGALGVMNKPVAVGPFWAKNITGTDPEKLQLMRSEFLRLVNEYDFEQIMSAHGRFLSENGKTHALDAVHRHFDGKKRG